MALAVSSESRRPVPRAWSMKRPHQLFLLVRVETTSEPDGHRDDSGGEPNELISIHLTASYRPVSLRYRSAQFR